MNEQFLAVMQGFAGGIMTAASFWSLLAPALEQASVYSMGLPAWFPAAVGFLTGGAIFKTD